MTLQKTFAVTLLAAGWLLSTGATAAELPAAPAAPASVAAEDPAGQGFVRTMKNGGDTSFMDKYFPFSLPDDLEPEVADNVAVLWVLSVFGTGVLAPLWAPAVLTGQGFPEDFVVDLLISDILHLLAQLIPAIGCVLVPLNYLYLCPVATIAIYDRNLKAERRGSRTAKQVAPGPSALALADRTAQMAY